MFLIWHELDWRHLQSSCCYYSDAILWVYSVRSASYFIFHLAQFATCIISSGEGGGGQFCAYFAILILLYTICVYLICYLFCKIAAPKMFEVCSGWVMRLSIMTYWGGGGTIFPGLSDQDSIFLAYKYILFYCTITSAHTGFI